MVAAATTWPEFQTLWGQLLGEVWGCLRAAGIERGCRNVILYRDSVPSVEVGVLLDQPCPLTGTRWEVYGPHSNDPAHQWTEISWTLSRQTAETSPRHRAQRHVWAVPEAA